MDANTSNAHGQLMALTYAVRALLDINPAGREMVKLRLEQASANALTTKADQNFLHGIDHIRAALIS